MNSSLYSLLLAVAVAGGGNVDVDSGNADRLNAATVYRQAIEELGDVDKQRRRWLEDPDAVLDDSARQWLRQVDSSIAILHRAATIPYCDWGYESVTDSNRMDTVQGALRLARVTAWRYKKEIPSPQTVADDQLAVLHLARQIGRDGMMIDKFIEIALDSIGIHHLSRHLHRMSPAALASLRERLRGLPPPEDIRDVFHAELTYSFDMLNERMSAQPFADVMVPAEDDSSFAHELRLASIVKADGSGFQIGLEEKESGEGFLLRLGERKRGIELVSVDFERNEAVLMKEGQAAMVHLESREIIPLSNEMIQQALVLMLGDEGAGQIESWADVEVAARRMAESAREEVQDLIEQIDGSYSHVTIREGDENPLFASTNVYVSSHLPPLRSSYRQAAAAHIRHVLLDAAIDVSLRGEEALADHPDPLGGGPLGFERTEQGFVLRSAMEHRGEKMALEFGPLPEEE